MLLLQMEKVVLLRTADGNSEGLFPGSHCCRSSDKGPTDGLVYLAWSLSVLVGI